MLYDGWLNLDHKNENLVRKFANPIPKEALSYYTPLGYGNILFLSQLWPSEVDLGFLAFG